MASLDLGALSYTLKLNREGFSEGINQTKSDMKGLASDVKTADEANKVFQSNMKNFQSSLQATGVSFENLDQKLRLWATNNRESIGSIQANNQVIEANKAKMAELDSQLSKTDTILKETKEIFGENSVEYKNVENSVIDLELKYRSLEEESKRLIAANKEMEASANPSFFQKLNSGVSSVGEATEKLGIKGISVGGILSKTFGSIKSIVMSTAVPIMAGMGLQSLIEKSKAGQQAVGQMNAVLTSTHGVAGMTKEALLNLAQSQSQVTTYSKGANIATENLLLTFTNIGQKVFPDALKAVNDMSQALGQDTKSSAVQLGKALNDPINGITALSRVGVNFTDQQKKQIATMVQAGDVAGAQKTILAELSKEFGGSATAAGKTFNGQLTIIKNQLFGIGAGITSQLMPPVTSFLTMLNSHIPQIQGFVNNIISGISTSFKTLGPIVLGIGQDIGKIAAEAFPKMNSSGNDLGKTILSLAKGALTDLKGIFDWLAQHGEVVRAAVVGITGAFAAIKIANQVQGVINGFNKIKKAADGLKGISALSGIFKAVFGINPMALGIGIGIVAIAAIAYEVITHWTQVKTFFVNLWTTVKQKFTEFWNWLKPFMTQWGPVILTVIAPFIGIPLLIVQHWSQIKEALANVWDSIKATVSNVFNGIASFFVSIWDTISNTFTSVIASIVNFVTTNFSGVLSGIQTIFNGIQTYFTGVWEAIKAIFLGAVLLLIDLVTGNFTKLSQDAQLIWNDLKKAFSDIWNGIKEVFSGQLQTIEAYYTTIFNAMVSFAEGLWNGFTSFLSNLWNGITATAANAWNNLKNAVTSIITSIVSTAQNIWNGLLNWFEALPSKLYNLGINIFNSMKNGVSSALSTLGSVVSNGFNSAISFITSLPSKALEWGKDFIDGLINGITSKVGAVGNAVSSVADKIRSFLHFSVPDEGPLTDYETWMPDFMQGLADGIDGNLNVLDNSLLKVSKVLASAVYPEASSRAGIFDSIRKGAETYDSAIQKLSHANDMLGISTGNSEKDLRNMLGQMTNISTMAVIANNQYQQLSKTLGANDDKTLKVLKDYQDYQKAYAETAQKVIDAEQKIKDNQYDEKYEEIDSKVKSLTSDTDDLNVKLADQQEALKYLGWKAQGLDEQYLELVKTYGEFSDQAKEAKKAIDENNQAIQDMNKSIDETKEKMEDASVSNLNNLFDKLKSALKDYYEDAEKQDEKYWQAKKDNNSKWKEDTLDSLESVYNAQKESIEKEKTLLDRNNDDEDSNDKIKEDQRILNMNYSAKAKADAQKDMNNEIKEMNRRHQKESLEDQEKALETQYNSDKDNIEKVAKANEDYYDSQIDSIKTFYENKEKAANLDAEAQQMIVKNNQNEIVNLLKSYGEDYEVTGASLGERLVAGFKKQLYSIQDIFEGVNWDIGNLVNKITSTPSVAINTAYSGGYGGNSHSASTMQQTTVKNSYGSLLHADNITINGYKDTQQFAEELEFLREKAARSRGGRYK